MTGEQIYDIQKAIHGWLCDANGKKGLCENKHLLFDNLFEEIKVVLLTLVLISTGNCSELYVKIHFWSCKNVDKVMFS